MLSLILPTYNESEYLAPLLRQIFEVTGLHHIHTEVIVVDDNSPDGTGELAYYLKRFFPHLTTFHREQRLGRTSAIAEGIRHARGNIIGIMNADLSHPPAAIPRLVMPLISGNVDITVASRYSGGAVIRGWGLLHRLYQSIANLAYRPLTPVRDPTSQFYLLRKTVISRYRLGNPPNLLLDLLVHAPYSSVQEIPFDYEGGGKHLSLPHLSLFVQALQQVLPLYRTHLFHRS